MATLTAKVPNAFWSSNYWNNSFDYIDEGVSSYDGQVIYNNTDTSGDIIFGITDMPSDFSTMSTLSYNLRYRLVNRVNDTDVLYVQVTMSNGTALTNVMTINTNAPSSWTASGTVSFTGLDTSSGKSIWDGARIKISNTHTNSMGADGSYWEIDAIELTGTYVVANSPPTVALNSPDDASTTTDTTPSFEFTGTDVDGNDIRYNIQIATDNLFTNENPDNICDSYDGGSTGNMMYGETSAYYAQSFDGDGYELRSIDLSLEKTGNPTGTITIKVKAMSGTWGAGNNAPTGSVLATSDSKDVSTFPTSKDWVNFTFTGANRITLGASSYYTVIIEYYGGNSSNYIAWYSNSSGTHSGNMWNNAIGPMTTYDAGFRIKTYVSGSMVEERISGTDSGFEDVTTPAESDPFPSGDRIKFTVQPGNEINVEDIYYWRVRGKDPSGSNTYGSWSSTRTYEYDSTVTLVVANTSQATTSDTITLDDVGIAINDVIQTTNSQEVALTQHNTLVVNDCTMGSSSENLTITYHEGGAVVLTMNNSDQYITSDNLSLTQHNILADLNSIQSIVSDSPSLVQHFVPLVVNNATHLQETWDGTPKVTLSSPANNDIINDTTPTFYFTGTDLEGQDIEYQIQIDTHSNCEGSPGWEDITPSGTHYMGGDFGKVRLSTGRVLAVESLLYLWFWDEGGWMDITDDLDAESPHDIDLDDWNFVVADRESGSGEIWIYDSYDWHSYTPGSFSRYYRCAIDGNSVFVAAYNGRLYHSTNLGSSWHEEQPAGDTTKNWEAVAISGDKMMAVVNNGRLYVYDGASWSEHQPAGNANKAWRSVDIDGDKMIAGTTEGTSTVAKIYYYDGSSWSDTGLEPVQREEWGTSDTFTSGGARISGDKALVTTLSIYGTGQVFYYNGDNWTEVFPRGPTSPDLGWGSCDIDSNGMIVSWGDWGEENYYNGEIFYYDTTTSGYALIDVNSEEYPGFYHTELDEHPFTQGHEITYTVQDMQILSPGTYYWRVRGKDPSGTNRWGEWSSIWSFIVSNFNPDDSSHLITSDNVTLTQHNVLSELNATNIMTSENLTLAYHAPGALVLEIQEPTHVMTSDNVTLTYYPPPLVSKFMGVSFNNIGKALGTTNANISDIVGVFTRENST